MPETLSQVRQTDSSIFAALVSLRRTLAPTLAFMSAANDEAANFLRDMWKGYVELPVANCPCSLFENALGHLKKYQISETSEISSFRRSSD
jgi:hypothetical protein